MKSDTHGHVTRIRDIGRVELGSVDYGSIAYADRYPSAPWFPIASPGANVVELEQAIWRRMAELKKSFPPGLDYIKIYDPTTFVSQSIHEVIKTVFIAIVLVVGVVFVFLQTWRATIIPVVAIPISLIGTFSVLHALGISINNLSMFGLILAVGIVVDDAIVVVENVERNIALGISPKEAAHKTMDGSVNCPDRDRADLVRGVRSSRLHQRHRGPVLYAICGHHFGVNHHLGHRVADFEPSALRGPAKALRVSRRYSSESVDF